MSGDLRILLNYEPSSEHRAALEGAARGAEIRVAGSEEEARAAVSDVDAVLGNRYFLQSLPHARRLRWMQSNSMGVDRILRDGGPKLRHLVLTNARGLYADEIADHALALLLALSRGIRPALEAWQRHRWERWTLQTLSGARAMILGWGAVGRAVGRRLEAFGVRVRGVRRRPAAETADPGVTICGPASWRECLPETEILVLCLPSTPATRGMVGAGELASLPEGAILVNVARGDLVDQAALLGELRRGRLRAGLDCLALEPPPAGAPIWEAPNLLVTPHVARSLERPPYRWEALFVDNLARFSRGEPLRNVVDQGAGY